MSILCPYCQFIGQNLIFLFINLPYERLILPSYRNQSTIFHSKSMNWILLKEFWSLLGQTWTKYITRNALERFNKYAVDIYQTCYQLPRLNSFIAIQLKITVFGLDSKKSSTAKFTLFSISRTYPTKKFLASSCFTKKLYHIQHVMCDETSLFHLIKYF